MTHENVIADLRKQVGRLTKLVIHNGTTIGDMKKKSLLLSQLLETSTMMNTNLIERCELFAEWASVDLEGIVYEFFDSHMEGQRNTVYESHLRAYCDLFEGDEYYDSLYDDYIHEYSEGDE